MGIIGTISSLRDVAEGLPVKQGLKHRHSFTAANGIDNVAEGLPVKQGLKHEVHEYETWDSISCRGTSSKTRIETPRWHIRLEGG